MATRELTSDFRILRNQLARKKGSTRSSAVGNDRGEDIEMGFLRGPNGMGVDGTLPPAWVDIMENVRADIEDIKQRMSKLVELHKSHLNLVIGKDEAEEEREIEIHTQEIKRLFMSSEAQIKKIGIVAPPTTPEEKAMRNNVQKSLVTQLMELSKEFKQHQRVYLQKMRELKNKTRSLTAFEDDDEFDPDMDEEARQRIKQLQEKMYDPGFTEEQVQKMIENEEMIIQRDKELRDILSSITELSDLFKDLSTMVIEQGTVLDRIDYNIEQVVHTTAAAQAELEQAEEYQKGARTKLCVIFLIVLVVALVIVLGLKLILRFSGFGVLRFF